MAHRRFLAAAFLAFFVCAAAAAQQQPAFPELVPLPIGAALAATPEPLPLDTLVEASLVLSGVPETSMESERAALSSRIRSFQGEAAGIQDQAKLAELALAFLHERILQTYSFYQTRVDTALDTGVFNCVSAAVLYMILARSVELSVGGVKTTDHAFCYVQVNGKAVDVETTNPYGYDPGTRKEFTDSFGKVTGFSYVPPTNSRDRRVIGEKELLALILYNRTSFEIQRGNFQAAIQPAATAHALVGSEESARTLQIAITDYTSRLGEQRQFSQALAFLSEAEAAYGVTKEMGEQRQALVEDKILGLIDSGSFDQAQDLLGMSPQTAAFGQKRWEQLSVYLIQKRAETAARTGDFITAAGIIKEGLGRFDGETTLLRAFEVYVHNQFARLFNSRRFTEAKDALTSALAVYQNSPSLRQDLLTVEKALKQ